MAWTKLQSENQQKANIQILSVVELWLLSTAFLYNVLYQCMKFTVESLYSLEVMTWTKNQSNIFQRIIDKGQ